ncbi:hypothetical protein BT69DRAFT_1246388 [Atractiella rhizophila]|nr:hypothetical protein BT69DRAFT_1246388 [Atractiella rhizophila]
MSQDPYYEVKAEIESLLQTLHQLHASYNRIQATLPSSHHGSSEELRTAREELFGTLESVEADVRDVEESVGMAERMGVPVEEVRRRRAFVKRVQKDCETIRASFGSRPSSSTHPLSSYSTSFPASGSNSYPPYPPDSHSHQPSSPNGEDDDPAAHYYERQTQTLLMQSQDNTLTSIGSTVGILREQAQVMGREIHEQVELVDDLSRSVDRTEGRMGRASKLMNKFIEDNRNDKSSWCVLILIIVLCILLIAIILT